jgi:hypothetical protein
MFLGSHGYCRQTIAATMLEEKEEVAVEFKK